MLMIQNRAPIALAMASLALLLSGTFLKAANAPKKAKDLFVSTQVWNIHLTFTAEEWEALEPSGGGGFFGGPGPNRMAPPGGPQGDGGPGGPGGPPRGGFGPAMFLAPVFMRDGDLDKNNELSANEFEALGNKWFGEWDKEKHGKINVDELRAGLNRTMRPPGIENRPPGAPEGPGPRPMMMNLQGPEGKRNGLASAAGIEFKYVHANLDFEGIQFQNVAVRYKGNGTFMESRNSRKRSLKIDLNEFRPGQKLAGITKLNLHNNVTDGSWMNEALSYQLYRDAGVPAPRSSYAKVFVTVPGKFDHDYFGLYSIIENVDKNFLEHSDLSKKGAIFKPVTPALFADLGDNWKKYTQTYDPKTDLSDNEKKRLMEFCKLVANAPDPEFNAQIASYIDVDEFARYMAVMVFLSDLDGILGPGQNFYLYLDPKSNQFQFLPWDQDHSFGQFPMRGTQEQREQMSIKKPWQGENRFLERMYNLAAFQERYKAALQKFSTNIFESGRFAKQVDELAAAIRPALAEESKDKLERFDQLVAGKEAEPNFGGFPGPDRLPKDNPPPNFPRFPGFGPTKPIKPFVKIRSQSIADQLAGKSEGQEVGGFGFPGGPAPGGRGNRNGPGPDFGPGTFLGGAFLNVMDANKNGFVEQEEAKATFARWYREWSKSGKLTDEELRAGINDGLNPFRGANP